MALSSGRMKIDFGAIEAITANIGASAADANIEHKLNLNQTVPNGTSLPATVVASFSQSLTSSTAYTDMTALPKANGATADCTGLKLQGIIIKNPTGNATLTIAHNTSTSVSAYSFIGTAGSISIPAGGTLALCYPEAAADVSSSAKNIIWAGTGTQSAHVLIIAG